MTEWHARYGGPGVMIYWHVERKSVCIYSQLKTCSASEVAAMLEGLLRHETSADVERNYTDTHGASIVGFAFCHPVADHGQDAPQVAADLDAATSSPRPAAVADVTQLLDPPDAATDDAGSLPPQALS
jgi:hypothetical protein